MTNISEELHKIKKMMNILCENGESYEESKKRMINITNEDSSKGFGEGMSPEIDFSERIATQKAKTMILSKSGEEKITFGVEEIEKKLFQKNGNYITLIILKKS